MRSRHKLLAELPKMVARQVKTTVRTKAHKTAISGGGTATSKTK
uniref:Uncharacterized protein n=1 Tax=Arundo donax TaxID=35708 RepID=A0A0A8ZG66_ARUDO